MGLELDPATVIDESSQRVIALNRNQNLLGKTMVVLKRPCQAVTDLSPAEWISLHAEIRRLTGALSSLFEPDQFNYAFLMNVDAQVHLHVIPRYAKGRTWRGQEFTDPNWGGSFGTEQHRLEGDDLATLAAQIRKALPSVD